MLRPSCRPRSVLTALLGVAVAACITLSFSGAVDMMSVTPVLGVMLGLAVGIDYSLFVLNRHRQQLRRGVEVRESIGLAVGTSGTAVFFAALTVMVALVALNITGIPFLGLMGATAGLAVLVALLLTLTLAPGAALAGRAACPTARRRAARGEHRPAQRTLRLRRPWIAALASQAVLDRAGGPHAACACGLATPPVEAEDSAQYKAYRRVGGGLRGRREQFRRRRRGPARGPQDGRPRTGTRSTWSRTSWRPRTWPTCCPASSRTTAPPA
ncbi:MMPL family transporter [Kocuria rhizophila]|nr:MMPL family transporter [Kocuria rhizophila]